MTVRLARRPDGAQAAGPAKPIVAGGTRIGRAPECDLVLDDALRLVSRQHAWLAPQGADAALLKCISTTAAIQVNGEPLPPGAERLVHDGDVLRLGGFEIAVEIQAPVAVPPPPSRPVPVPVPAPVVAPVVAAVPPPIPRAPLIPAVPVVPAAPVVPALPAVPPISPMPPMPRRPAAMSSGVARMPATVSAPASPSALASAPAPRGPRLDRFFDLDTVADPLGPGSPLPTLETSRQVEVIRAPRPVAAPLAPPPPPVKSVVPPPPVKPAAPPPPVATALAPVAPIAPVVQAFDASLSRAAVRAMEPPPAAPVRPPVPIAPPPPIPEPPAAPTATRPDALPALRQAFLRGAGLEDDAAFQVDPTWMAHLGALLRASTEGTLGLLRSRSVTKRSIRAENTQIVARENNPLKFAPDGTQALLLLMNLQSRRGFLDPVDAVRDAHNDLQVHQIAMVAGMRAAVYDLISRLGPEATEAAEGPAHGLAQSIPALRDAALWRRHKLGHERMLENLDDVFEVAFGREFLKAYEAQAKLGVPPLPSPDEAQ